MILTLSHGQAAIERGFSINKDLINTNMLEETIVAKRVICDGVMSELSNETSSCVAQLSISNDMLVLQQSQS